MKLNSESILSGIRTLAMSLDAPVLTSNHGTPPYLSATGKSLPVAPLYWPRMKSAILTLSFYVDHGRTPRRVA